MEKPTKRGSRVCVSVHRATDLEKQHIGMKLLFSSWAFVYPPLLFHLSRALLGAWRFGLFRCVYSVLTVYYRLDLIREPAFYWVFYFPSLALFVSS